MEEQLNEAWGLVADKIELDPKDMHTAGTDENLLEAMSMK